MGRRRVRGSARRTWRGLVSVRGPREGRGGERSQGPPRDVRRAGDSMLGSPARPILRSSRLQSSGPPHPGSLGCGRALQTRARETSHGRPGTGSVGRQTGVRISGTPRVPPRRVHQCSRARENVHACASGGVYSSSQAPARRTPGAKISIACPTIGSRSRRTGTGTPPPDRARPRDRSPRRTGRPRP